MSVSREDSDSPVRSSNPIKRLWALLDTKNQDYDNDTKLIIEFIKQLIKSTGTGLLITLAFRMLRHIRNIGRPGKIIADLLNFYRTKSAYSTGLLCFILCFFIRGGVTIQKIFRRDGKINYFIPGGSLSSYIQQQLDSLARLLSTKIHARQSYATSLLELLNSCGRSSREEKDGRLVSLSMPSCSYSLPLGWDTTILSRRTACLLLSESSMRTSSIQHQERTCSESFAINIDTTRYKRC